MFLGESGHFHFWVNVTTFTFAFFHFCFLSFGPFVILNCSSCQKNATDEGAIALKALDFQINVKNCISYFNIGGQKKKSVEYNVCNLAGPALVLRLRLQCIASATRGRRCCHIMWIVSLVPPSPHQKGCKVLNPAKGWL